MKFISNSEELAHYLNINIPISRDIKEISIDSRNIIDSSLFICIRGNNFDGNDFKNDGAPWCIFLRVIPKEIP